MGPIITLDLSVSNGPKVAGIKINLSFLLIAAMPGKSFQKILSAFEKSEYSNKNSPPFIAIMSSDLAPTLSSRQDGSLTYLSNSSESIETLICVHLLKNLQFLAPKIVDGAELSHTLLAQITSSNLEMRTQH